MNSAYLSVAPDGSNQWHCDVHESYDAFIASEVRAFVRVSPIFPVAPKNAQFSQLRGAKFFGFFTLDCPFSVIGGLAPARSERLWFSHGVAAVILPTNDRKEIEQLQKEWKKELRALEIWDIQNSKIVEVEVVPFPPVSFDRAKTTLATYRNFQLQPDLISLLDELQLNLFELTSRAAQHFHQYLATLEKLTTVINGAIDELKWLLDPTGSPPDKINSTMAGRLLAQREILIPKRINQSIDTLIQLNSSLTYVVSQAFHGASPILEHRTLVSPYSLLGVGTAWRAIARFTSFIENIFENHPVVAAVKTTFKSASTSGINVRYYPDTQSGPSEWRDTVCSIDDSLEGIQMSPIKPKLVAFSGRLGFGETEFTATAATQLLGAADSSRWSLMTLSHELLHAHVHGLLAVIFRSSNDEPIEESEKTSMDAYWPHMEPSKLGRRMSGRTLAQGLVFAVYQYASWSQVAADLQSGRSESELRKYDNIEFKRKCNDWRWLMEEIMVHVLDLHYFYHANTDVYVDLLWESWATVPSVIEDLDNYLMRTLSAVASTLQGSTKDRFAASMRIVKERIDALMVKNADNTLLKQVAKYFTEEALTARLRIAFGINLYIAEMTLRFFFSKKIQSALSGGDDRNIAKKGGEIEYRIDTAEFSGASVANPVAFVLDRLRRCADTQELPENYRTAWMFLAGSSDVPRQS